MSNSARRYRALRPTKFVTAHDRSSIYASAPFKFIIDGNPLYIHAELVSRHSKPLDRMINGNMSEAQSGRAIIEDVDEETFLRFIQWAYSGYYEAGKFKIDSPRPGSTLVEEETTGESYLEETVVEEQVEATQTGAALSNDFANNNWRWAQNRHINPTLMAQTALNPQLFQVASIPPAVPSPARGALKESFINRKPTVCQQAIRICPPRHNQAPNEDYTEVFLSHARVYVFAEKYDIQSLKALALDELHGTLQNFDLHPERTGDIIALLRYIYANTGETVDGVEDMRTVLKHYVGFEMDTLMKDDDFGDLMIEDGGALLGDFLKMVEQRIG